MLGEGGQEVFLDGCWRGVQAVLVCYNLASPDLSKARNRFGGPERRLPNENFKAWHKDAGKQQKEVLQKRGGGVRAGPGKPA